MTVWLAAAKVFVGQPSSLDLAEVCFTKIDAVGVRWLTQNVFAHNQAGIWTLKNGLLASSGVKHSRQLQAGLMHGASVAANHHAAVSGLHISRWSGIVCVQHDTFFNLYKKLTQPERACGWCAVPAA